jgi:hypothetical protein
VRQSPKEIWGLVAKKVALFIMTELYKKKESFLLHARKYAGLYKKSAFTT